VTYSDPDSQSALERNRERYQVYKRDPRTLGWRPGTQLTRFAAFFAGFATARPERVLDIGCGFGDLLSYLRSQGWEGHYVGVDLVPEFVDEARVLHADDPRAEWHCLDFLATRRDWHCDAAFASGLLNHLREDHTGYIERFIAAMVAAATTYIAVDFLSTTADRRREDLYFADPAEILRLGLTHSRRVQLDHGYMPFEFTLRIWPDDRFAPDWPVFVDPVG
jgi:SAM-dependent methyltransferase